MFCPFCTHEETKVVDSRLVANGSQIKRRRECLNCGERFSTYEEAELVMPRIIKSNERREPFDEEKLRAGLHKALEKRPVSSDQIENALQNIKDYIRKIGEREIQAQVIGKQVMNQLKDLDQMNPTQVSLAKWNNVRMALDVARDCRDMLGGSGISAEYVPIRHMLNLESVVTYEGTETIHQLAVGRSLTGKNAF